MTEKSSLIAREASVTNQRIDRSLQKPRRARLLKNRHPDRCNGALSPVSGFEPTKKERK